LDRAGRSVGLAARLGRLVAGDSSNGILKLTGKITGSAFNPIFIHGNSSSCASDRHIRPTCNLTEGQLVPLVLIFCEEPATIREQKEPVSLPGIEQMITS
jgi:hypothetical protein